MINSPIFITLDFLFGRCGGLWLIEANGVPFGFSDWADPHVGREFLDRLVQAIGSSNMSGQIYAVCSANLERLAGDLPTYGALERIAGDNRYTGPLSTHAADLIRLRDAFARRGLSIELFGPSGAMERISDTADSLVFWFTQSSPQFAKARVINPGSVVDLTKDKLRFSDQIGSRLSHCSHPPTQLLSDYRDHPVPYSPTDYFIVKPRRGFGGANISRVQSFELPILACAPDPDNESELLVQPWIEPNVVKMNGFEYYYDLRVVATNLTSPLLGFRVCSFPLTLKLANSRYWWLPSLGEIVEFDKLIHRTNLNCDEDKLFADITASSQECLHLLSQACARETGGYDGASSTSPIGI